MGELSNVRKGAVKDYKTVMSAVYGRSGKGRRGEALKVVMPRAAASSAASNVARPHVTRGVEALSRRAGLSAKQTQGADFLANFGQSAGMGVVANRSSAKALRARGFGKAATPVGAGRLTALALKAKNPQVQSRAFAGVERNLINQRKARGGVGVAGVAKSHGVGRHLTRDQNSTPGSTVIRTPSLRQINGKFAGQGEGVKVFHPKGRKKGAVHSDGLFHVTKGDVVRKGMLGPVDLGAMAAHTGARRGVRLVEVEKSSLGSWLDGGKAGGRLARRGKAHPTVDYGKPTKVSPSRALTDSTGYGQGEMNRGAQRAVNRAGGNLRIAGGDGLNRGVRGR